MYKKKKKDELEKTCKWEWEVPQERGNEYKTVYDASRFLL